MNRNQLLAAELFGYSFANYADHLGIGNERFDTLMPREVAILESAERERWPDERVAGALECEAADVSGWRERFRRAVAIVDAPTPAEAFRRGVRDSIEYAIDEGLPSRIAVEQLVTQVCYRAADLALLLNQTGKQLADYSGELRAEAAEPLRLVE